MTSIDTNAPTDRFVEVPNFRIHYTEAGTGHPVVLLHGSGPGATGATNFGPNIGPLSETFRVIAIDMPGWGESDTQTKDTGRDHVAALVDVLDALDIQQAALVGNSMGGMTSLMTAILHPDRVSHLITMGAPSPLPPLFAAGGGVSEGMKILLHAYREPTAANMKRLVEVMCFSPSMATDELAEARSAAALARPDHLDSWNSQFDGGSFMPPFFTMGPRLREIVAPTLLIHGRDDRVVHFEHSLSLASQINDSRMVLLNRCGHWAQIEHAEEFNRLVTSFVTA